MKKFMSGMIFGIVIALGIGVFAAKMIQVSTVDYKIFCDGKEVTSEKINYNGRTYIELRESASLMGGTVEWNAEKKEGNVYSKGYVKPTVYQDIEPKEVKLVVNGTEVKPDLVNNIRYYVCVKDGHLMLGDPIISRFITCSWVVYPEYTEYKFSYLGYRFTMTSGKKYYDGKNGRTDMHVGTWKDKNFAPWFEAEAISNETGIKIELTEDTLNIIKQ